MAREIPPLAWEMGFRRRETAQTMSQEKVEIVRRVFQARAQNDVETLGPRRSDFEPPGLACPVAELEPAVNGGWMRVKPPMSPVR